MQAILITLRLDSHAYICVLRNRTSMHVAYRSMSACSLAVLRVVHSLRAVCMWSAVLRTMRGVRSVCMWSAVLRAVHGVRTV